MPDPNDFMDNYVGSIVCGLIRDAAIWRARCQEVQAKCESLEKTLGALRVKETPAPAFPSSGPPTTPSA